MLESFFAFWAFLAFGTLWFWVTLVILSIIVLYALDTDAYGMATFFVCLGIVTLGWLAGNINVPYLIQHPYELLGWGAAYFVIGAVWSVFRWWRFGAHLVDQIEDAQREFIASKKTFTPGTRISELDKVYHKEFVHGLPHSLHRYIDCTNGIRVVPPQPHEHKSKLTGWITHWPFSALGYVLDEPIRKLTQWIYRKLRALFSAISERQFNGLRSRI